ncbi:MAG: mRNA splicing protein prp18 [Alectoria sarmentosa]|nr:MAG: mRNA splicing protein prp18 [Alectoria sarmentosa]
MDFASLMSAEISKSTSSKPSSSPTPAPEPTKKYLKRAELEAQRQQAYLDSQAAIRREREAKLLQKRKRDEEDAVRDAERDEKRRRLAEESRIRREEEEAKKERARRKRLGLPELIDKTTGDGTPVPESEVDILEPELTSKLRALSEPALLFGETHPQRLRRYYKLVAIAPSQPTMTTGPIPTTLSLLPESEMKVSSTIPKDGEGRAFLFRQLASYFTMVLTEWSRALASRAISVKESHQGKQAYNAYVQSRTNMTPLFRKFESGQLEDGILTPMVEIVVAAQEKRYVDANDGYLRLSIGKAAWPIGVTMVGIHERSAREKLHESDNAAHIMSDEVTRKFLQSIKRCLSFAQTRWPPEDLMQLMG